MNRRVTGLLITVAFAALALGAPRHAFAQG